MNIDKNIQEVPIEDIIPNRFQPRLQFNEEGITELSESIKQHGIIQPLVVRRLGDKFEIIAGERRYKASTMAGLTKVPVIISDIDDNQSAELAVAENIQRRNLSAIEEAKSYKNLLDRGYLTQEQLANKMGVSQSTIANKLRLLNLDEEVQEALLNEKISERHARALLSLEESEDQKKWLKRIIEERMTVRQLDLELKKAKNGDEEVGIPLVDINPNIDEIVNNAEDINVVREPHDVASMLIPEGGVIAPAPTKEELEKPAKMPNKFFNFLEEEQVNMNVIEPEEILNTFNQEVAPISVEETNPVINSDNTMEQTEITENTNAELEENKITLEETETNNPESLEILDELDTEDDSSSSTNIFNTIFTPFEEPTINQTNTTEEVPTTPVEEPLESVPEAKENNIIETVVIEEEPTIPSQEEPIAEPTLRDGAEEISSITIPEEPTKTMVTEETNVEPVLNLGDINAIKSDDSNNEIMTNEIKEQSIEPIINNEEITPFKSIFFTNEEEEENVPTNNESPINNTIEEVKPIVEEPMVDPLDSIVKLEPDYEEKQQELAGTDLKTAINVVRDTVSDLENRGFIVELEEADLEDLYHITIKINKENNKNQNE